MTTKAKKPCRNPSCPGLTTNKNGFCDECQPKAKHREKAVRQEYDTRRDPTVKKWLNSARYKKARKYFLATHPFCVKCSTSTRPVIATILDHVQPHRGDYHQFWEFGNWQPLCKRCHDRKTASEDGGFGNPKKD